MAPIGQRYYGFWLYQFERFLAIGFPTSLTFRPMVLLLPMVTLSENSNAWGEEQLHEYNHFCISKKGFQ